MTQPTQPTLGLVTEQITLSRDQLEVDAETNIRASITEASVADLATSIAAVGITSPVQVRRNGDGKYHLVAGFRRIKAVDVLAKKGTAVAIPAVVLEGEDHQLREAHLIENLQRQDLDPIEEAKGLAELVELGQLTQAALAKRVNRSSGHIASRLRLLSLPASVQRRVSTGTLSISDALELAELDADSVAAAVELEEKAARNAAQELLDSAAEMEAELAQALADEDTEVPSDTVAEYEAVIADLKDQAKQAKGRDEFSVRNVRRQVSDFTWARLRDAEVARLEAEGIRARGVVPKQAAIIVDQEHQAYAGRIYLGGPEATDAHTTEDCHAVVIERNGYAEKVSVTLRPICLDPGRHRAKGVSDLKIPKKEREVDPHAAAMREWHAAIGQGVQDTFDGARFTKAEVQQAAWDLIEYGMRDDNWKVACQILGIDRRHEDAQFEDWGEDRKVFSPRATVEAWRDRSKANAAKYPALVVLASGALTVSHHFGDRGSWQAGTTALKLLESKGYRIPEKP